MHRRDFLKAALGGVAALGFGGPVLKGALDAVAKAAPVPDNVPYRAAYYAEPIVIHSSDLALVDTAKQQRFIEMKIEMAKRRLQTALENDLFTYREDEVEVDGPFHVDSVRMGFDSSHRTTFLAMAKGRP